MNWKSISLTFLFILWFFSTSIRLLFTPQYLSFAYHTFPIPTDLIYNRDLKRELASQVVQFLLHPSRNLHIYSQISGAEVGMTLAEQSHLQDVKKITIPVLYIQRLLTIFLLLLIGYLVQDKQLSIVKKASKKAFSILSMAIIPVGIFSFFLWNVFFTLFHQLLFPQGNWAFPEESFLITVFPDSFWFYSSVAFLGLSLIIAWFTQVVIAQFSKTHETSKRQHRADL